MVLSRVAIQLQSDNGATSANQAAHLFKYQMKRDMEHQCCGELAVTHSVTAGVKRLMQM